MFRSSSDGAGSYAFNALTPTTYTLRVAAKSFSDAERRRIILSTQDFLTLDIQLTVGSTSNVVQVSADAPLVDPSTASISTNFDQQRLEDIPVLGRNPYITAKLSGVIVNTGNPQFIRFADQNGTFTTSVAGGPVAANLYLVDGAPITDTNNRPIVIPTMESIQDVKVQANTYDARVGRTGGGVFNTFLRSGSNTVMVRSSEKRAKAPGWQTTSLPIAMVSLVPTAPTVESSFPFRSTQNTKMTFRSWLRRSLGKLGRYILSIRITQPGPSATITLLNTFSARSRSELR